MVSDAIKTEIKSRFFKGKEGSNNQKILKLLLRYGSFTQAAIKMKLGKSTTAHDRITALKENSLIEEKGEKPARRNKRPLPLYWLTPYGLWVTAHEETLSSLAIGECQKIILPYWKIFTEIYHLDKVKTKTSAYKEFTKWLESDNGTLHFLDTFGAWPLAGRGAALGTFRRMIDLALLRHHGAWIQILQPFSVQYKQGEWQFPIENPYQALAEIAVNHEEFKHLDEVLKKVDEPLNQYLDEVTRDELIKKLTPILGEKTSKKLSTTPFFTHEKTPKIGTSSEILNLFSPDILFNVGTGIKTEEDRVIIATDDPDSINPEWKEYCDLYVIRGKKPKRIPARRVPE